MFIDVHLFSCILMGFHVFFSFVLICYHGFLNGFHRCPISMGFLTRCALRCLAEALLRLTLRAVAGPGRLQAGRGVDLGRDALQEHRGGLQLSLQGVQALHLSLARSGF